MLKLKNIKITNEYAEADYTPEDSKEIGRVKINLSTDEVYIQKVEGYERVYPIMASEGLRKIIDTKEQYKDYEVPKEKIVMWY